MKIVCVFLLLFPIVVLSNDCLKTFESLSLKEERYSPSALKKAMNSINYRKIIAEYPKLSKENERVLFELYRKGNQRAFQILFLSNMYMVPFRIKKWTKWVDREDLFQTALIALLRALEKYDFESGIRFTTYLGKAIDSRLQRYVETKEWHLSVKWTSKRYSIYKILRDRKKFNLLKAPSVSWVEQFSKEHPDYSIEDIKIVLQFLFPPMFLSYESSVNAHDDHTFEEILPDENINVEKTVINKKDIQIIYTWALQTFPEEINQAILKEVIFASEPKTFRELGKRFSITKTAIGNRYHRIIEKIQSEFAIN